MAKVISRFCLGLLEGVTDSIITITRPLVLLYFLMRRGLSIAVKGLAISGETVMGIPLNIWRMVGEGVEIATKFAKASVVALVGGIRAIGAFVGWVVRGIFWAIVYTTGWAAALAGIFGVVYGLVEWSPAAIRAVSGWWPPPDGNHGSPSEPKKRGPWHRVLVPPDAKDRAVELEFLILLEQCHWVKGSAFAIRCDEVELSGPEFVRLQLVPFLSKAIERRADLVVFGAASNEGKMEGKEVSRIEERERVRAGERAENMARWIAEQSQVKGRVWSVNLGQSREPCLQCTDRDASWQRRVVVATIINYREQEISKDFLWNKMKSNSDIPDPAQYGRFDIKRLAYK